MSFDAFLLDYFYALNSNINTFICSASSRKRIVAKRPSASERKRIKKGMTDAVFQAIKEIEH